MKIKLMLISVMLAAGFAHAADPAEGLWKTIDDKTGNTKALVQVIEKDGVLGGVIQKRINPPSDICSDCEGKFKGKSLKGVQVFTGLKKSSDGYSGGTIIDPKTGKSYRMNAELSADGKTFEPHGYIGIALIGRTQTWIRAE